MNTRLYNAVFSSLDNISLKGGNYQDAYTISALLGESAPYLDDIRKGIATEQMASDLRQAVIKELRTN